MSTTRRDFLKLSSAAAGSYWLGSQAFSAVAAPNGAPLKILVLGGTGFLGPAVVEAALARSHKVTLFNRGKTNPHLFPELEKLVGDRDPDKGEGLKALGGRKWDVCIDDTGYYPRMVKASASLLAPNVRSYIYISSISAYAENSRENQDETAATAKLADPTVETMGKGYEYYGGLKALCEQAANTAMGGRCALVRPGFIVGPGDSTDRFTWWPVRVARGGEMLGPGAPSDPIQIIDVRDLGAFLVRLAEQNTTGTFNACGPKERLTIGKLIEDCATAAGSKPQITWVPAKFLMEHGEDGDGSLPIWIPFEGETKGFHTWSNARAVKAGLSFRPTVDTARDTLAWFRSLPEERQKGMKTGLSAEAESRLLTAWRAASSATQPGGAASSK